MGRTARSMEPMRAALDSAGFDVINIGYSSYCCGIAELGVAVRRELEARRLPAHTRVHFVGHSLGNIIVRWILTQPDPPAGVGRIVMLAPPNQGSHEADRYSGMIGWLLEPIGELRTDSASTVRQLPPVRGVPIGIIAGKHDGKLTVEETRLPEAREHRVVDGSHAFLMRRPEVLRLTISFLKDETFGTLPDSLR
jgi:pimeloyl-ACP methyl ester carboxylesterase